MNEETLLLEALSRPPRERAAFLEGACLGRPEVLASVKVLLSAHEKPGNLLDQPPTAPGEADTGEFKPEAAGPPSPSVATSDFTPPIANETVIAGRYTLIEKIGEGGMGEVWVARQTEPVKRKVALKLIKPGMDSRAVLQRFEQERQALALMEHPNIARVIDGGMTDEHRPFFVMELVNGLPLTAFCDGAKMGIRERLELFASICQAVQHAHQKGIIHRDLKPTNILITIIDGKPVPKVIDFGVAKATSGRLTDDSISTQFGAVLGTLEYMSPEQAAFSGEDIDTRADIYSLGVILYEMLTGLRPIDARRLKKAAFTEMIRLIKEEDPSKPSTRLSTDESAPSMAALRLTEPRKLTALLRGELDWVVMKCLEKQRDRRYETANALARDIQRFLADEVVEARPPSAGYRLRKFVSRHRGQVAAAGLVLLALLAGITGTAWGLIREAKANSELATANANLLRSREAVQERYELAADAIRTFHTGVSEDFLLKEAKFKDLRERLLTSATDFYERLCAQLKDSDDLPSRRALLQANFEMAELAYLVNRKEDALALHRRVLAGRESLAASAGAGLKPKIDVARSLVAVGWTLQWMGQANDALAAYDKARSTVSTPEGNAPEDEAARSAFADARYRTGRLLNDVGRVSEALGPLEQAGKLQKALAGAEPKDTDRQSALTQTLDITGYVQARMAKPDDAMASHKEALAIRLKLVAAQPDSMTFQRDLAWSYINVGIRLKVAGKLTDAMASYEEALKIRKRLSEANPAVTDLRDSLANSYRNMGSLLIQMDKLAESLTIYRTALAIQQELVEADPASSQFQDNLFDIYTSIGPVLLKLKRPADALASYEAARENYQQLTAANPTVVGLWSCLANIHSNIGSLRNVAGKPVEAIEALGSALAIQEKLAREHPELPDLSSNLGRTLNDMAIIDMNAKRFEDARVRLQRAIELQRKALASNPSNRAYRKYLATHLTNLICATQQLGDADGLTEARRELANLRESDPATKRLYARVSAIIRGDQALKNNTERLELAQQSYDESLHATAARLWTDALAADPKLVDNRSTQHRYNAACAAALASADQGMEPVPDEKAKARLRDQALLWLNAELETWSKFLETADPSQRANIAATLQHWKEDADLIGIREPANLATLVEADRARFKRLWEDVDGLLTRARNDR